MNPVLITLFAGMVFLAGCTNTTITDVSQCGSKIICQDGSQHEAWNIVDGKCAQINYFRDPCGALP